MSEVAHLVISSTIDYSTDYICLEMERRGLSYLRLNRDQLPDYKVSYDPSQNVLSLINGGSINSIKGHSLKSIYFRAPTYIRSNMPRSLEEQLMRSQWSSFVRSLMVFDDITWMNNPMRTYVAENKMLQLKIAHDIGLKIPPTQVANYTPECWNYDYSIVKALDTALFYEDGTELFTYSISYDEQDLSSAQLKEAPVIIQKQLTNKTDLRVTIIGKRCYAAAILLDGQRIEGDWRVNPKNRLSYIPIELPDCLERNLLTLMDKLGLSFGGVDLAIVNDEFYFIEINPTGEWGWLVECSGFPIHEAIVDYLEDSSE